MWVSTFFIFSPENHNYQGHASLLFWNSLISFILSHIYQDLVGWGEREEVVDVIKLSLSKGLFCDGIPEKRQHTVSENI